MKELLPCVAARFQIVIEIHTSLISNGITPVISKPRPSQALNKTKAESQLNHLD